jgi:putative ABC transport system permease protein
VASVWGKVGWRNLGRNKRRTLIAAAGLGFGYFAVVFMVGWADGLKAEMIENGTGLLSGQIQIHSRDYRPERSLYETIGGDAGTDVGALLSEAVADPEVVAATPRVYAGGLVSSGQSTSAGMLMGFDPEREPKVSRILTGLTEGRLPESDKKEIVIGSEMARQLGVGAGAALVLVAPAADGSMGNDIYTVAGIFRTGMAELDATYALVPSALSRDWSLSIPGGSTRSRSGRPTPGSLRRRRRGSSRSSKRRDSRWRWCPGRSFVPRSWTTRSSSSPGTGSSCSSSSSSPSSESRIRC